MHIMPPMASNGSPMKAHQNNRGGAPLPKAEMKLTMPIRVKTRPAAAISKPAMRKKVRVSLWVGVCNLLINSNAHSGLTENGRPVLLPVPFHDFDFAPGKNACPEKVVWELENACRISCCRKTRPTMAAHGR
jgi:hypothetical protein